MMGKLGRLGSTLGTERGEPVRMESAKEGGLREGEAWTPTRPLKPPMAALAKVSDNL